MKPLRRVPEENRFDPRILRDLWMLPPLARRSRGGRPCDRDRLRRRLLPSKAPLVFQGGRYLALERMIEA